MMSDFKLKYFIQFIVLTLIQVLILDHILFLGYVNPYLYILFILGLPINLNRVYVLLLGFALGLCIDLFSDTGGVHAASTLLIAYLRPFILRLSFGISYDYNTLKLNKTDFKEQFLYVVIMVFIHHSIMFSLEYFSINYTVEILKNTLLSGIFSSVLIFTTLRLIYKG